MKEDETPLTKRQQSTLLRRKQIVEAAAACIVEQGIHQTSIRDIAKSAGISLGNLYNHFKSKDELVAEIAALEAEDLVPFHDLLGREGSAQDILDRFSSAYFDYVSRPENAILTAEITAEAMRNPQIVGAFSENRQGLVDAVADLIASVLVDTSLPSVELSETYMTLIERAATRCAFEPASKKKAALKLLKNSVDYLFRLDRARKGVT